MRSGLLTVYVWNYGGTGGSYGHAAMTLEDGTHISWWPKEIGVGKGNADEDLEPSIAKDIAEDIEREDDKMYDYSKKIDFLDESAWAPYEIKAYVDAIIQAKKAIQSV